MSDLSAEDASRLVERVRRANGAMSAEAQKYLQENLPLDWEAYVNVRRQLGATTRTLATNLYSKDTRFVYELIQNAEDNHYGKAKEQGVSPFLHMNLYEDRLVLDSNEDGFSEQDLRAICSTAESSKKAQGYIGEKGIGFKSVFKVAKKVHIQSGSLSFSFSYLRGTDDDDGLGMVTPNHEPPGDVPCGVKTRITLFLISTDHFDRRADDLTQIPEALLLFLTKLTSLEVGIHRRSRVMTKVTYTAQKEADSVTITQCSYESSEKREERTIKYLVVRKTIAELPEHEARPNNNAADVVLAFPVDAESTPMIKDQMTFAYLPMKSAGFKFLIQSDFITDASREQVEQCPRNLRLLNGVAITFNIAVLKFASDSKLRFQWMRYLPQEPATDDFWKDLQPRIYAFLQSARVIISRRNKSRNIGACVAVPRAAKDKYGQPLFRDRPGVIDYLSDRYEGKDVKLLKPLGLRDWSTKDTAACLEEDLKRDDSFMKACDTSEEWHSQAAKLLIKCIRELDQLSFIPLRDGTWASSKGPASTRIYWPTDSCMEKIPEDVKAGIVCDLAVANPERKLLFKALGLVSLHPREVIRQIERMYYFPTASSRSNLTLPQSITHLEYFFKHSEGNKTDKNLLVPLFESPRALKASQQTNLHHVYFSDLAEKLNALGAEKNVCWLWAFHFLHPDYIECPSAKSDLRVNGLSWRSWLSQVAGVESIVQIQSKCAAELSTELKFLAQMSPQIFLATLKENWKQYFKAIEPEILELFQSLQLPSQDPAHKVALNKSFYPTSKLLALGNHIGASKRIILANPALQPEEVEEWTFLKKVGVDFESNFRFYSSLLQITASTKDFGPTEIIDSITRIYAELQRWCYGNAEELRLVRLTFREQDFIFAPGPKLTSAADRPRPFTSLRSNSSVNQQENSNSNESMWLAPRYCVWKGPEWLTVKTVLSDLEQCRGNAYLFEKVIGIQNAVWQDYILQIQLIKDEGIDDSTTVAVIYEELQRNFAKDVKHDVLRADFQQKGLVYIPQACSWGKPASCLWAENSVKVPGKVSIKESYPQLEDFFCRMLGIQEPSVDEHVAVLVELSKSPFDDTIAEQLRSALKKLSNLKPSMDQLKPLVTSKIFPVRKGKVRQVTSSQVVFAIVDRQDYGQAFDEMIWTLDFELDEVYACMPFLKAMDLNKRLMSTAVSKKTYVDKGRFDEELSRDFRQKAYALVRCAKTFQSSTTQPNDYHKLLKRLANTKVSKSSGIAESIEILQSLETYLVKRNEATLHIEESGEDLLIYVPNDGADREHCYGEEFPQRLCTWLKISDFRAQDVLQSILRASNLSVVDRKLTAAGILEIPDIGHPNIEQGFQYFPRPVDESRSEVRNTFSLGGAEHTAFARETLSTATSSFASRCTLMPSTQTETSPATSAWPEPALATPIPHLDDRYAKILDRVIKVARGELSAGVFSSHETFDTLFPERTRERDYKVGAAGELFVYEYLKRHCSLNLSLDNWQSTIRHHVNVHSAYSHVEQWQGRETADLVYDDVDGLLTSFFEDMGNLPRGLIVQSNTRYLLEVKTTPSTRDTAFYVSEKQYQRIQRYALDPAQPPLIIYVLFRVYNIDKPSADVEIYLDPAALASSGELSFVAEGWRVTPGIGCGMNSPQKYEFFDP